MPTLYDLTGNYASLLELAEDGTIDPEVLQDTMDSIVDGLEDKAVGYVKVVKQIEADAAEAKAEAQRLSERATSYERNAKMMRQKLADSMAETNQTRFKTPLFTIYTRKTTSVITPDDPKQLPPDYLKAKTSYTPDKKAIKDALQDGKEVPNARLVEKVSLGVK